MNRETNALIHLSSQSLKKRTGEPAIKLVAFFDEMEYTSMANTQAFPILPGQ